MYVHIVSELERDKIRSDYEENDRDLDLFEAKFLTPTEAQGTVVRITKH